MLPVAEILPQIVAEAEVALKRTLFIASIVFTKSIKGDSVNIIRKVFTLARLTLPSFANNMTNALSFL